MITKRRLLPRAILAALLLALPAAADAPRDPPQYDRFDGDTAVIKDAFTKLGWDRRGILEGVTWDGADCSFVAAGAHLPTVKELLTILDEDPHTEYEFGKVVSKLIDRDVFSNTLVEMPYWTSTPAPAAGPPEMYWTLSFATGAMVAMPRNGTAKANARCLR